MNIAASYFPPELGYPTQTGHSSNVLAITLLVATVLHACIILGITFSPQEFPEMSKGLEITIATAPSTVAPEQADFIAQENQAGSGTLEEATLQSSDSQALARENQINEVSIDSTMMEQQQTSDVPVLSTIRERDQQTASEQGTFEQQSSRPVAQLDREQIAKEIASLEAEYSRVKQEAAKRPRVSRQNTAATKRDISAWYRDSWRKKVERVGNLNYPQEARRDSIYGSLRLLVLINSDGSIANIEVRESSGQQILDQAAQRIVRLSAPFPPFTGEMAAKFDQIEIIRTWRFSRDDFLTSQ